MSKGKIWLTVLITVLAVFALAAGSYALYRYGYARGLASEFDAGEWGCYGSGISGELGELEQPPLGRGFMQWGGRGRHMSGTGWFGHMSGTGWYGHMGYAPFGWIGGLFGLVFGGGVLALAGYGIYAMIRRSSAPVEVVKSKK